MDGKVGDEPIGTLKEFYLSSAPYGYLETDGSDTTGTSKELSTHYPILYAKLGNSNVLPDYRECTIVGIGQSTNNYNENTNPTGIQDHDVFTLGEFKDDQLQSHTHDFIGTFSHGDDTSNSSNVRIVGSYHDVRLTNPNVNISSNNGRYGTVTHGKRKGALICIKAL